MVMCNMIHPFSADWMPIESRAAMAWMSVRVGGSTLLRDEGVIGDALPYLLSLFRCVSGDDEWLNAGFESIVVVHDPPNIHHLQNTS